VKQHREHRANASWRTFCSIISKRHRPHIGCFAILSSKCARLSEWVSELLACVSKLFTSLGCQWPQVAFSSNSQQHAVCQLWQTSHTHTWPSHDLDTCTDPVRTKGPILEDIFQRSSYVRWFRNSKEVLFSEFLTAFFAFPKKFFFSYLCRLVQPIRRVYTDHVM